MDTITIDGRKIGVGFPAYIVAELSAGHDQNIHVAKSLISTAKSCGADAVKLQTYTPDNLTIDSDKEYFMLGKDSPWKGKRLYDLYSRAAMPMEWHGELFDWAKQIGITIFSTAYDVETLDYLVQLGVPAIKTASFELTDTPFMDCVAEKKIPTIISTGMANIDEIVDAVAGFYSIGTPFALLKCTSEYPAPVDEMNVSAIRELITEFRVPVGLSDHSKSIVPPVVSIAYGASIIEKHIGFETSQSPDAKFSLNPIEFKKMVFAVREAGSALGTGELEVQPHECSSLRLRRSLFVVKDIAKGEEFTPENIRSIRPNYGLHPDNYYIVLGKTAKRDISRGEPLTKDDVDGVH